jgi:hypothetical protein
MKILYKPFAIIASLISKRLGKGTFRALWSKIDDKAPPSATMAEEPLRKVLGAAVLEAATMAGIAAAVHQASARAFHYLTGVWPGDKREDEEEEKKKD